MQEERFMNDEETSQSSNAYHIQHNVSKMDTLAGLAIKYGVEVADIKKMNGLVTDHQMFAVGSVQIPMPGKHPPSPVSPVAPTSSSSNRPSDDRFNVFSPPTLGSPRQKHKSPAMSSLQSYYGIAQHKLTSIAEDADSHLPASPSVSVHPNRHRKTKSLAGESFPASVDLSEDVAIAKNPSGLKSVRRRQKADGADASWNVAETENALGLVDAGRARPAPSGDPVRIGVLGSVRKSSSTSNLQDACGGNLTAWQPSIMSLKTDHGLPRPMAVGRSKEA